MERNTSKFKKIFMKDCDKNSNKGYIFEYLKYSHDLQSDLPFLPEGIKIKKFNKLVYTLFDKKTMLFT